MVIQINNSSDQHSNSVHPLPETVHPLPAAVHPPPEAVHPSPEAVHPLPEAVRKFSDPTSKQLLAFPFVGLDVPGRFKLDDMTEGTWSYEGRTKFKELVQMLKNVRESGTNSTVWLYGTRGYGKSYLLAALVCYLVAQDERVVYIPDCRALLEDHVKYVRLAMLFAWADDSTAQEEIVKLHTEDAISAFFDSQTPIIFVVDQKNGFNKSVTSEKETTRRADLLGWIGRFTTGHKRVFSSSANHADFHDQISRQHSNYVLSVYGGLTRVSHLNVTKRLLTRLGGNGRVVEAKYRHCKGRLRSL